MKIKDFGDLGEYVDNQDKVLKILENYGFDIVYNGIKSFYLDGRDMYNYKFIISNVKTGNNYEFDYSGGVGNDILDDSNKLDKVLNALWCIISDFCCYYMDFDEFVDTFGYGNEKVKVVTEIWNKIIENNNKLLELMSEDDIEVLRDNIQL